MSIDIGKYTQYRSLLSSLGASTLHYLFPQDFEVYICSLELVDSSDKTLDLFVWPVMPEEMSENISTLTNIQKTSGGVCVLKTDTFIPTDIMIRGNFGRKLKLLLGRDKLDFTAINYSTSAEGAFHSYGEMNFHNKFFSNTIKTGYGAYKVLQSIVEKSRMLDKNKNPLHLYFYNPALGNSYMVEAVNIQPRQSRDLNMIWSYTLNLRSVAPICVRKSKSNKKALKNTLSYGSLQQQSGKLFSTLQEELTNVYKNKEFSLGMDFNMNSLKR